MIILRTCIHHRVFIFIVGIQFLAPLFTPPSLSLSFSISLLLSPNNSPIYLSLSYSLHLYLSFFPPFSFFPFKTIRPKRRVWERVIDGAVSGWEMEGDWKRKRERYREKISNESVYVVDTDPNKHLPAFTVCPKKLKKIYS